MEIKKTIQHPTWIKDIQFFFTEKDKMCMQNTDNPIDLGSYEQVSRLASKIHNAVESGYMPKGGPQWSKEKVETFSNWYDDKCPFGSEDKASKEFTASAVTRLRKNVKDLSNEEQRLLIKAFEGVMARDKDNPQGYFQIAGIHGFPNSFCEHHSNQYNPWHRFYTIQFEDALRSISGCEGVTLPFWDITESNIPSIFNQAPFNSYTLPVKPTPIPGFVFPDNYKTVRLSNTEIVSNIQLLKIKDQISFALNQDTWEDFHGWLGGADQTRAIIPAHDNGHVTFGHPDLPGALQSTMMMQHVAAFEPMFWFFHCNLDRLWWEWQKKYNATTEEGLKNRIKGDKRWLNRKVEPFIKTSAESVDILKINLVDGTGIDYAAGQIPLDVQEFANARGSLLAAGFTKIKSSDKISIMIKDVNRIQVPGTFSLSLKSNGQVIDRQFFFQNSDPPNCANCITMPLINFNFVVDTDQVVEKKLEVEIKDMSGKVVPLINVGNPTINARLLVE